MSVGLLIITHNKIGEALLLTATQLLDACPLETRTLDVSHTSNPDEMRKNARKLIQQLDRGSGVLVLTDIYGSTPSNIAATLLQKDQVHVVAGINLPMLVRVLNYADLDLNEITAKAVSGGSDGIVRCQPGQQ